MRFIRSGLTRYPISLIDMEIAHEGVKDGKEESIFIVEHEALYSAGKSFEASDFLKAPKAPIYFPSRGGRITVHSEGQIVIYPILDLFKRNLNVSQYVALLEQWIIDVLMGFGIKSERSEKGIGVFVNNQKIGFVGIKISRGITLHGLCLNVSNDLKLFEYILPCGLQNTPITSISKLLGHHVEISDVADMFERMCKF